MGDGDAQDRPGAAPGGEEQQRAASWLARGCLAAILLAVFIAVFLPLLIWAAAIILAGSR